MTCVRALSNSLYKKIKQQEMRKRNAGAISEITESFPDQLKEGKKKRVKVRVRCNQFSARG